MSVKRYMPMPEKIGTITGATMFEIKDARPTDGFVESSDYQALANKHAKLLAMVEDAPHDEGCRFLRWEQIYPCNCWKSEAMREDEK